MSLCMEQTRVNVVEQVHVATLIFNLLLPTIYVCICNILQAYNVCVCVYCCVYIHTSVYMYMYAYMCK